MAENSNSSAWGSSISATTALPPESSSVVSNDSARRCAMSGRTLKRSTTTSMLCFFCSSSFGGSERSQTSPSIRARIYPCAARFSRVLLCSPLRSLMIGASSIRRLPSGCANTLSTIWLTVCAASGVPCVGQRGSPTRANSRRR